MATKDPRTEKVKACLERIKIEDFNVNEVKQDAYTKFRLHEVCSSHIDKKVAVFGWVTSSRSGKSNSFFELTSQFETVKCFIKKSVTFSLQTTVMVFGTVSKNQGKDSFEFEITVDAYSVYGGHQAPSFPLNKDSEKDKLLDFAHLGLRLKERSLFLQAQSELLKSLRMFYWSENYTEITPPTLVQTQVEGGATLFKLDYYGSNAYLTQTSQLYLETAAPVCGKAFCIMPSYRAEKSNTARHLSEFTHVEAELVDITFSTLMDQIEALVRKASAVFYKSMLEKIKKVYPGFEPVVLSDEKFKRISYKEAIEFLYSKKHMKTDGTEYKMGDDIADASEKYLIKHYANNQPLFLTSFPVDHKPFYVAKNGTETEACDLLFPGMGEIVGGSMRHTVYEELMEGFKREGIDPKPYYWYLDMSKYGPSPHGGYGLGFERLLLCLMKYKSVDQASLYCRKPSRCTP
ncbi:SYNC [Enterospora canceri]|uniref:asparagine--tRNA ligase n=1 Tax=Enterospora canceri TaxID=1081671 RepID=A0A1Y1S6R9_9MICR|nr:SYNC [Enterospora canceri]